MKIQKLSPYWKLDNSYQKEMPLSLQIDVLVEKINEIISYTCCNIEVNEKVGTEVHCPSCKEYCETKGGE